MDEITIGDKTYISSKRAAEITGYAKDYVGQLCREGHLDCKMVGRSWYVFEPSIRKHRFGEEESTVIAPDLLPDAEEDVEVEPLPTDEVQENSAEKAWEPTSVYKAEPVDMIPELQTAPVSSVSVVSGVYKPVESIPEDTNATLTDMQSAWREWFVRKQESRSESLDVPETRTDNTYAPEVLSREEYEDTHEDTNTEEEFSIPIHKIQEDTQPYEEKDTDYVVPIQRIQTPAPVQAQSEAYVPTYTRVQAEPARVIYPDQVVAATGIIRNERVIKKGSTKANKRGVRNSRKASRAHTRSNALGIALLVAISMVSLAVAAIGTGYAERYVQGQVFDNPVVHFLVGDTSFKR